MNIIDRRLNPGGKSLGNRQKFIRRAKEAIKAAVRKDARTRDIKEMDTYNGNIVIPGDGLGRPSFQHDRKSGRDDYVLPGNRDFTPGDEVHRPSEDPGSGSGGSADGDGVDPFQFVLSREEYLNLFLEDLELPNLVKQRLSVINSFIRRRAGYSVDGSPANMSLAKTMRNSLMRRIALGRPKAEEIANVENVVEEATDPVEKAYADHHLGHMRRRMARIPYIDPMDVRYRRFEEVPQPKTQAVVFCLMDVSGSMGKGMKDLAKRFYTLLYLFLNRYYENVDIVFIRHTQDAEEVDEDTFFHSAQTGGTIVSSAFDLMTKIVQERYDASSWNIYVAQASDGDNYSHDNERVVRLLREKVLPITQYFAYLEILNPYMTMSMARKSDLWNAYAGMNNPTETFAMRQVAEPRDIYPVFRELFERKE